MSGDERHEEIGAAVRRAALTVQAPPSLREKLAAADAAPPPRLRRRMALVPAGVLAALVAALVLAAGGGPTVQDVARAALQPATGAVPGDPHVGRVHFPSYGAAHGWEPVGARRDELGGRDALTVAYRHGTGQIGYAIVSGGPLDLPGGHRSGRYAVARVDGATVVAWHENGHTCVLASRSLGARGLLRFASWS